jgi:DNA sulfur modification protein DndB
VAQYTIPAIRGVMGSTTFYQAVMRADELAATVRPAMDFPEFKDALVSEKMQRDLSEQRVEAQIVPYLVKSKDRFFGSIIVLAYKPKVFIFESFKEISSGKLDHAYRAVEANTGALTISGGSLFALDGQHRLHALRTVINNEVTPHLGLKIEGPYKNAVASDMLSVIFLEFESVQKARRIFNKVNRYAKPTSKAVNILTSEDDGLAIVARTLAGLDEPADFGSEIEPPIQRKLSEDKDTVSLDKTSLSNNDPQLMTIELIHKSVAIISAATGKWKLDEKMTIVRPEDKVLRIAYETCSTWWHALMNEFEPFVLAREQPEKIAVFRQHAADSSVAFRPIGQEAILRGLMEAHKLTKASPRDLVERLNSVPLSLADNLWNGILLGGGEERKRVITTEVELAGALLAFMLVGTGHYGAAKLEALKNSVNEARARYGIRARELPRSVV